LFFGVVIGCLIPMVGVSRLKEKEKKRNTVLTKEYPYFVDSLWLYIQSGMTIKRALGQYVDRATPKNSEDYLIKELKYTLNQIATGQSEYEAYDELGSRLGLPVYGSLMRHISQNLKMGTKDLKGLMETEVSMALDSRRETAKSLGEQASTKLIFPMIVLLMVVMIIIIAPAMMGL
ncbi:MAG: type II secretion system F family protein, partial [Lachnospiraceae bacterium]|nr:type II secretion system F family protein [Lachnospiraceae bacterium]